MDERKARSTEPIDDNSSEPTFAVLFQPGPRWIADKPVWEQALGPHLEYWRNLSEAGYVLFAGPFLDEVGGAALVRAVGRDEAARLLSSDPAIIKGILIGRVTGWKAMVTSADFAGPAHAERAEAKRNAAIVRNLFSAVERRDVQGILGAYDATIQIHEAPSLPYGGDYQGHEGALQHAKGYRAAWEAVQGQAERALEPEILAWKDRVVVVWRQKGHRGETGKDYDLPVVSVYRLDRGRVIDSRMFHFDAAACRDFLVGSDPRPVP